MVWDVVDRVMVKVDRHVGSRDSEPKVVRACNFVPLSERINSVSSLFTKTRCENWKMTLPSGEKEDGKITLTSADLEGSSLTVNCMN